MTDSRPLPLHSRSHSHSHSLPPLPSSSEGYTDVADIEGVLAGLRRVLGEIPILVDGNVVVIADEKDGEKELEKEKVAAGRPKVRADGTYATETANTSLTAGAMLIMMSIIRVGQSKSVSVPIDEDSLERIMQCIQTLGEVEDRAAGRVREMLLVDGRKAFGRMLGAQEKRAAEKRDKESEQTEKVVQVDNVLTFRQFVGKGADEGLDVGGGVHLLAHPGDFPSFFPFLWVRSTMKTSVVPRAPWK